MSSTESFSPAREPRKFEFEELAKATRYFSNEQLVGIGDFGDVYEGSLPGVKVNIAIKKLKYEQDEKQEAEFKNQIKDFGTVSHPNLVKLLGYCCEEANRLLVLEFVPNKSLRFHLSDENRRSNLNWSKRMKIAIGSARGLAHLHDECYPKIIHGDIKSDNILLDNDFAPKVADFGLAKIFSEIGVSHIPFDQEEASIYIDPENYYFQNISEKSDVYSFGVILLELITGRRLLSKGQVDIVNWVRTRIIKGNSIKVDYDSFVDSALKEYDKSEMKRMIYCAAATLYSKSSKSRPTMEQIVGTLEGKISCEELWVLEVNTGKASESRSSKAGDMSETTSSPFQELKEITEASNLHWSKATSSQGIEPEIMQIQEMHAKSHYSALEQAATLSETSLEATTHNVMPSSRLMKVYHILNEIMTRIGNPNISTIGVCGGEGVGKTTLLEALKIQPVIRDVFQFVIWVTVPKVPNPREVQLQIARQLPLTDKKPINAWTLLSFLEGVKFFLILDGVQEFISLNTVGIPDPTPENGCKIVLTTRSEQVCDRISVDSKINLENLLCKLFWENVGESIYSSNLQPVARKVVDLCCYHSHAIFLMSKALKDESDVDVWDNAIETLNMEAASPEQELEHIMVNVLKFSYLRLPDDTTRRCLKNGALFFENEKIARKSLIDNWISDDLTDTYQKGRNVLETLVTAGLLERSEDGQFFTLHEIDRCILLEHVFPSIEGLFLMRNDSKLTELPKDVDWKEFHEIYLMDNKLTELSENLSCPKAQALFLQRNLKLRTISDSFFHGMLALQILNLSGTPIKYLPDPLFDLVKLKRFSLNHCVLLKLLPSGIGNLSCLEVFHLEGTQIIALPKEVERLKNLTSLKVSFREPLSFNQQTNMIPDGFILNLTELKNLWIDVSPEDNRWKASVRRVVLDVSTLTTLDTLQFYFPNVELLSHFNWNTIPTSPPLSHFKFTVGDHTNRIIRRLPHDAEIELGRYDKCLKHVNGKGAPEEIKKVLRHASAFFLDRNTTVEKFSEFEITNMTQLKCCVAGECDKLQAIINGDQMVSNASGEREVGLQSLEYLYIYYARSLRSIWEGRLDNSSLKALKYLTLYMCPQLTTIFTPGLLANLSRLEELTVKDCSQVTRLVSGIDSENEIKHINLPLKKISLHFLPQLDRISDVLSIAQEMEWMSFYYCPNLKSLSISKASHTKLRKIKGEESWWKDILEWENTERDSWEGIFTPCGESEEFSQSFKRSDALLEATASPLLEETTSKSKSLTEGNPSETMILSQFRGKGAEISQSLNESDALEATASSLFEVVTEMTSESKSLIRGDSSETMIPAQFGETTSESKSLTEEDPSETMIPALFRGKSAEFSPPLMELDAQEATASSLFEVDTETSESKSLIEGDPFETMIPAQFREMRSLHKDYEAYELRKFTFPELAIATGHFTNARLLGSGGFGTVYRGTLRQGKEVAIKKLYFQLDGQQQEEIEKEINAVGNVRHENVVKLIGYCREDFDTLLVLEFVPNNSLRCHLNDEERRSNLKWSERMKIAIGSAKGLAYLHEECNPKIIHRDIKAEKILLDDNCEPKIAGFGFAKFFPETNSVTHISSCWKRTNVYADPEDYYPQKDENILQKISEKSDVYSFGVVLLELITGRKIFDEHRVDIVNWAKPFMFKGDSVEINYNCLVDSALKGDYIKSEMELMIYCAAVSVYRPSKLRPRMKQIVEALEGKMPSNELWVAEEKTGSMAGQKKGSIAFFATYKPPVPLDIFSCPVSPTSRHDELHMTDGLSYNYNCQVIPPEALKTIIRRPILASEASEADVDSGRLSGLVFVSERDMNLETLHIALRFTDKVKVLSFADIYGTFSGVRMEDSGGIAGGYKDGNRTIDHCLVYVTTKEPVNDRRQPWTVVYKTNLKTGETKRLTPSGVSDLSPSVSPSGAKVAVASFQRRGWNGEIEDLQTDIYVMDVEKPPLKRKMVITNGGWPTWGSDDVIFFHRKVGEFWSVFRADISSGELVRVTPDGIDAVTPAAINGTKVAVATIRQKSRFSDVRVEAQYRHIEIFDLTSPEQPIKITQITRPKADHFNPFVIDGGKRIGYHRCKSDLLKHGDDIQRNFHKLHSPHSDVGLFRVSGVFPSFSKDGSKLAFVDNEFKAVWVADSQGLRIVYESKGPDNIFSPVWNQDPQKDTLYVCMGPSFNSSKTLDICAIPNVSSGARQRRKLTRGFNNAFPSTSPDGTRLVFRSTRDGAEKKYKNLYIMEDAEVGEYGNGKITRLTNGQWTDTHCQWSPTGDWIVFSSTRDKPDDAPETDNYLDPGYFAVYLVKANDPSVVVRVIKSGDDLAGHVNHPCFSPDGKSIAVTADLAAVSVDPISLPMFLHSVRPYGDVFTVDIDPYDINKNKDVKKFNRITHSRYENSTPTWTCFATEDPNATWNLVLKDSYTPSCPYAYPDGGESWHMTGHLCIPKRCC